MIDSKLAIKAINSKLDSMSHDEAVAYLKSMGFSFKEEDPILTQKSSRNHLKGRIILDSEPMFGVVIKSSTTKLHQKRVANIASFKTKRK